MTGAEYQARDERCLQEYGQEYEIQEQDSTSPPPAPEELMPPPVRATAKSNLIKF